MSGGVKDPFNIQPGEVVNGTAVKVGSFKAGSDEWHAARAVGLGGSEVAAAAKLSPWESRFSLYYRKKLKLRDIEITAAIEWGNRLEDVVFQKYSESLNPGEVITTGDTFHHIDYEWMVVNPDGIVWRQDESDGLWYPVRILEIKTSARGEHFGDDGSDQIPIWYLCQVLWYSFVLSTKRIQLAALISGVDYRVYNPRYSTDDVEFLINVGKQFMHDLEHDIEPDLTKDSATYEAVRQINPLLDPDGELQIDKELRDRYIATVDAAKAAKVEKEAVDAEIIHMAGDARLIKFGEEVVARRQMPGGRSHAVPYLRRVEPKHVNPTSVIKAVQAAS